MPASVNDEAARLADLPCSSGPVSQWMLSRLVGASRDPLTVDRFTGWSRDEQLALFLAYEPHFTNLPGQTAAFLRDPEVVTARARLEDAFVAALVRAVGPMPPAAPDDIGSWLHRTIDADDGPSLSSYMEHEGTIDDLRDYLVQRSGYQLKEGDGHSAAIPALQGRAKQLLVAIQAGEYGADAPGRSTHAELFSDTMTALGLDGRRNASLGRLTAASLALSNVISMFGLNPRWRAAAVGHLAVFELTSVVPMGRFVRASERLDVPRPARRFFDVHVLADAEHEVLAVEMVEALAEQEPSSIPDLMFGARCAITLERWFAESFLASRSRLDLQPV